MSTADASLKILHILDHSLPLHSGYAFRTQNILRAQLKRGWGPMGLTSFRHEQNWQHTPVEEQEIDGLHYYRMGAFPPFALPLVSEYHLMKRLACRITEVIRNEQPDLLHTHSPVLTALPTLWVGRKVGIPVIYEIRAFWEDAAVDHGTYEEGSWKYKLTRSIETWVCRKVDRIVVLCWGIKNDLIKRGIPSEKITIVANGIALEEFCTAPPDIEYRRNWRLEGKKVIGFIGSFYRYEGLDFLVNAVASLTATRSDIALLLVGGGEMEEKLREMTKRLHLENVVIMPGRIPQERIPRVYALIDILAYPRYPMRLTELVTPLKPLEAMAAGKAVVASDVGGHQELIRHGQTGVLFPAGDAKALQEALAQLLDDPAYSHTLSRRAGEWVRCERSWDRTTAAYSEIYAKALDRRTLNANGKLSSHYNG